MTQIPPEGRELELPSQDEIERRLRLGEGDRPDLGGLYRLNTWDLPLARFVGVLIALAVAPVHNAVVLGTVDWGALSVLSAGALLYALGSWAALRAWFHRSSVHLGFAFTYTDLVLFAAFVHATGGPLSLYWPIFLIRVADQMWLARQRAASMVVLSVVAYSGLLALWSATGVPLDTGSEIMKIVVLGGVGVILLLVSRGPLDVFERTTSARDLILRLENQSMELDEARVRAEAASRSKSEFLARMSHELRTPLNSVVGFTNVLLKRGKGLEARERDYLERIRQNGVHLLSLIDDILDLASIEQGRMAVRARPVELESLVRETLEGFAEQTRDRSVELVAHVPSGLAPVSADPDRLRQVLDNLVSNAVKFTPEGTVTVRVVTDENGVTPRALEVTDTGVGIPRERMEGIFETFEQGEGGTARRHGGTGLGLPLSRSLCALMGISLHVRSEVGVGTTFTIGFPSGRAPGGPTTGGLGAPTDPGEGDRPACVAMP